jgi:hypothetical protein
MKDIYPRITIFPEVHTIILNGLYPFSHPGNKRKFKVAFEQFAVLANTITIDAKEPCLFLDKNRTTIVFDLLHDLIDSTKFSNLVILKSVHLHTESCYTDWCRLENKQPRLTIQNNSLIFNITRPVQGGYSLIETDKDKTMSLLIGNLRFQKAHVLKWYLNNIFSTRYENKVLSSFMIDGRYSIPKQLTNFTDQIKQLPGKLSDNSQSRNFKALWNGSFSKDCFNSQFSRSLFNFCIDYVEFEDFQDYTLYESFKKQQPWWKEDGISEKTFMCILFKQPFIRLGMPHSLKTLHSWGFRTYDGILFDENYDTIENFYDRAEHIFSQVMSYLEQPFESVYEKVYSTQVQEVVDHNYNLAMDIIKSDKYL